MKNLFTQSKTLLRFFFLTFLLAFETRINYAQIKVGDNPAIIHAGSALEIESSNKGLLLPRVELDNTLTWQLDGDAVAGMQVFNTNPSMSTELANYPVIPGGIGIYYWDGNGWVPSKYAPPTEPVAGDFDWLKSSNNANPSDPADISSGIYHGGDGDQEVVIKTTSVTGNRSAQFRVSAAAVAIDNSVDGIFFANNSDEFRGVGIAAISSNPIVFRTAAFTATPSQERMRITATGRVGINNSNPGLGYMLDVTGSINSSGSVRAGGVVLTSDARLKENIQMFQNGLEIVSELQPVSYKKKESISDYGYGKSEIGFIAQDLQKILPQLVHEGKDVDKILAIDYNSLIPILTRAIQEQQKQIDSQSAELKEIKHILKTKKKDDGMKFASRMIGTRGTISYTNHEK